MDKPKRNVFVDKNTKKQEKKRKRKRVIGQKIFSKPAKRTKKPQPQTPESKKPVFGDVTQGFKDTIQSVIDEGGSPKLTTTEAIVDRSIDKLNKPKLALRGGGRAYGKNS
jgi:hypothetical protein